MKLMKRWIIGITVCLLVFAVLAAALTQIVLLTDLPRRLILQAVADQTGLNVQANAVSVRWGGRTTVREATVSMPLDDAAFLSVGEIDLSHTSLPVLLARRSLRLRSVRIMRPEVFLRRDERGRWNVQDVADYLAAVSASRETSGSAMALPSVDIQDALIRIAEPNRPDRTVGPLEFQGIVEKGLVWRFALRSPQGMALHGQLTEGGNWAHWVEFVLDPNATALQAMLARQVPQVRTTGRWDGRVEKNALRGAVRFTTLEAGPVSLAGTLQIATQADGVTVSPDNLILNEPNLLGERLRLAAGKLHVGPNGVTAQELRIRTETTAGQLSGQWDFSTQAGECSARWAGKLPRQEGKHSGTVRAILRAPDYGLKEAQLITTGQAQTRFGTWRVAVETHGAGNDWAKSSWRTSLGEFTWTRDEQEIDLSGARVGVAVDGPHVRLTDLSLPNTGKIDVEAQLDRQTWQWAVQFDAQGLRFGDLSRPGMDVRLRGQGDSHKALVSELRVVEGKRTVTGKGQLSVATRELRDAHISAQWPDRPAVASTSSPAQSTGQWAWEVDIAGTIAPLALDTSGSLTGRNVRLGKRQVAKLDIPVQARVDADRVEIATSPFALLGGRWQLSGQHEFANPQTQLHLTIQDLSLQAAAEMAGSPIQCQGQATAQLQLSVPGFQMDRALAFGNWDVTNLNVPPFEAQKGHGQIRISGGLVRFDEIQLIQDQGQARGAMRFRLDQPQRLSIQFDLAGWPVRSASQPFALVTDSRMDVQLDVVKRTLDGQGQLASRFILQDKELGRIDTLMQVRERTLKVDELHGQLLGGSLEGAAEIPLDRLTASTVQLQWRDIEPAQLAPWWPGAAQAGGTLSGFLKAVQTDERERPLEPLRIEVQTQMADGRYGQAQVKEGHLVAYLGSRRFLVDKSTFRLLGGEIKGWARISPHAGKLHLAVTADVNNFDLNQIAHVLDPNAQPIVGKLSGRGALLTSSDWRSLSGQADLNIAQSDLVNNPVVRTLYDTLSLDLGQPRPEGTGQVDLLLSGTRVRIPSFVYFNRGVEIRGAGTIRDFSLGSQSPVDGYAVGSTRVLKGVPLPGVKQLDRLMSSLQSGIASVTINGTINQTKVRIVPLPVVGDAFRGLLWNQLREQE